VDLAQLYGLARSLLIYYGVPGRAGRVARHYRHFIAPGDVCFDLGAHVGNRVLAWRRLGARVVAVEPNPACVRLLRLFYGRDPRVAILKVAAARHAGTHRLHLSSRNPSVSTLSHAWAARVVRSRTFARVRWDRTLLVPAVTLDDLIARFGQPAFCKIDVEGSEADVMAGLSRPLRALSFEYVPAAIEVAVDCVRRLEALGAYEYNLSPGESLRWASERWLRAEAIVDRLGSIPAEARAGDVYARFAPA
jgi:FkbM family methyltransferase